MGDTLTRARRFLALAAGTAMAALLVLGVEVVSAQSDVVPGTPTSVATTSSNAEATVTWLAPVSNGGTAVTGYSVAWASNAVQGMTSGSAVVAAATTAYSLTGLVNGVTYAFTVTATNAAGNGAASTSVAAVPYTRAGSPSNLVANALAGGQVNLTWSPPGDNGGAGLTGYRIERRVEGGEWAVLVSDTSSTLTSYLAIGLDPTISYEFQTSAWNAAGMGAMSAPSTAVSPVAPTTTTTVAPTTATTTTTTTVAPSTTTTATTITPSTTTTSTTTTATTVAPSTTTTVAPLPTTTRSSAQGMVPPRPVYIG
jgi:titin